MGNIFLGFEHPLSRCAVENEHVLCSMARELPIKAGQRVSYSSVIGVSPPGQMRRAFLNYLERERAHPYRPFLHYNSWYDIGYENPYDQADALDVIHAFGEELATTRHVKLDSFLFDDGWDDPRTLWNFNAGFPEGFAPVNTAAATFGAAPGIWLSPWGGYDKAKEERLKYGRQHGYETNQGGFALSGPKYYARFREVTLDFIHKYGIDQFKIDGTGNVNSVFPGSEFDSDFHAAISLIGDGDRCSRIFSSISLPARIRHLSGLSMRTPSGEAEKITASLASGPGVSAGLHIATPTPMLASSSVALCFL